MRLRLGCALSYDIPNPTPMIAMLNVHYSHSANLERPDQITCFPAVPLESYRDLYGNWCTRLVAPAGKFTIGNDCVLRMDQNSDPVGHGAFQSPVELLPSETLIFLLASRYCETDALTEQAWRMFGNTPLGWARVQAIVDFVHQHIQFGYEHSRPTRTAAEAMAERRGVCRDFAHLAIALCRAMNIPARYCTGYISDVGLPPPYAPQDFAAWMEVFLGGQWWTFDPRNNALRYGRVLIARGRDAADVPLTMTFGPNLLSGFTVWADEVAEGGV